ncbi:MAG: hypothetical protein HXS54_07960 [Theionarchaea archaeon]|nr:hypothetical protein [Theionarchaea archaeon]
MNGSISAFVSYMCAVLILFGFLLMYAEKKIGSLTLRTSLLGMGISVTGVGAFIQFNRGSSVGALIGYAGVFIAATGLIWQSVYKIRNRQTLYTFMKNRSE